MDSERPSSVVHRPSSVVHRPSHGKAVVDSQSARHEARSTKHEARTKLRALSEFLKFEHTVFALPFAYIALLATGAARASDFGWVTLAMVGARTAGMSLNRLIDEEIDRRNPRTASRPLQTGAVRRWEGRLLALTGALLLIGASIFLHPNTLRLLPIAIIALVLYSFLKRWTWAAHFGIGAVLALAPLGAWIAVTGSSPLAAFVLAAGVLCWVAGFDILYSLLDLDFDRLERLRSIPARWGIGVALKSANLCHSASLLLFAAFGVMLGFRLGFWVALILVAVLFKWEHSVVREDDLSRVNQAFFTANGWVGFLLLLGVFCEGYV